MRIADRWGRHDVDELMSEMSADQIAEWDAFFDLCPHDTDRLELMLAQLTAVIYAANGGKGKDARDFIPDYVQITPEQQSEADIKAKMMHFATVFGGRVE